MAADAAGPDAAPPERVVVQWCIGCGAIDRFTDCPGDCAERRLELVPVDEDRALASRLDALREDVAAYRRILEAVAASAPAPGEAGATAYRELQRAARAVLRERTGGAASADPVPDATVTVWWHPRCGRIEAPAPCIGVCVRHPVVLVPAGPYVAARAGEAALAAQARALRTVVHHLAWSTPREGAWDRSWAALTLRAREVLGQGSTSPRRIA